MKKFFITSALSFALLSSTFSLEAATANDQAKVVAEKKIKPIIADAKVIEAIKAQNEKNQNLSEADVKALDDKWRQGDNELISSVLENPLSQHLKEIKAQGEGLYTEIFVMDNKGLNVGQSDKTSDLWQGDEAKWQETYAKGPDAIHISDIEKDDSSGRFQMQISMPVLDGQDVIGSITVGVNAAKMTEIS